MGHIIDFEGTEAECDEAQAWCRIMLEGRWDCQSVGRGEFEFAFTRGDEAALFRDRHKLNGSECFKCNKNI